MAIYLHDNCLVYLQFSLKDLFLNLNIIKNEFLFSGLKRYKILSLVGDGTYGLVYMATNVETREKVAIKGVVLCDQEI